MYSYLKTIGSLGSYGLLSFIVITLLGSNNVFAGLQTDLLNQYINAQAQEELQDIRDDVQDVYLNAYKATQANQAIGLREGIEYTQQQIQCQNTGAEAIQKDDIITILVQTNPRFTDALQYFQLHTQTGLPEIKESCLKVMNCLSSQFNANDQTSIDPGQIGVFSSIDLCQKTVNKLFITGQDLQTNEHTLKQANFGQQIFENGTLDDSEYDLLIDIQNIADLLFENNKEVTETIFYQLPYSGVGGNSPSNDNTSNNNTPDDDNSSNTVNNNTANSSDLIDNANTSDNISDDENTNTNNTTNNTTTETTANNSTDDNNILQDINSYLQSSSDDQSNITDSETTSGLSLVGGNICVSPDQRTASNQKIDVLHSPTLSPQEEQTRQDYQDYVAQTIQEYSIPTGYGSSAINDVLAESEGVTNSQGIDLSGIDPFSDLDSIESIRSCINTCDEGSLNDKMACIMQCSCSITPSESEKDPDVAKIINYQVKFCWIPTQAATVTRSNKSVQSIEEIVNELNTILTALKQSGELTKRNETQELLDTSLENKDMAKSFVFSLNVSSKPAGNSGNDEEILQKTLDEAAKQNRETIRGTSNEISTIQKNKYVVISNVALNTTSKQAADTTEDKLNNSNIVQDLLNAQIPIEQIKENSQQDAIITQSNVHTSNTALFLRDSIKFWEQVTGFVELQQDISLILKNKIEAAQG